MNNNHLVPNKHQSLGTAPIATEVSKQDIISGINELLEVQANAVGGGGQGRTGQSRVEHEQQTRASGVTNVSFRPKSQI
jgi:hypothetical protein